MVNYRATPKDLAFWACLQGSPYFPRQRAKYLISRRGWRSRGQWIVGNMLILRGSKNERIHERHVQIVCARRNTAGLLLLKCFACPRSERKAQYINQGMTARRVCREPSKMGCARALNSSRASSGMLRTLKSTFARRGWRNKVCTPCGVSPSSSDSRDKTEGGAKALMPTS